MKRRHKRGRIPNTAPKPECRKCGKYPHPTKADVLAMMERDSLQGHAYRCGNIWHHSSNATRGPSNGLRCELPILHSLRHGIEAIKASWSEGEELPNLKICRHWSHGDLRVWHVVPFSEGQFSRPKIRKMLNPERHAMELWKKRKSAYRNNGLMVESWENEGGALWPSA